MFRQITVESTKTIFTVWQNMLWFVWRLFNIPHLLKTLFSPWKKDVSIKSWRGFHPGKSLEQLALNGITRLLGSIVRSLTIITGITTLTATALLGIILIFLWITTPITLPAIVILAITKSSLSLWTLALLHIAMIVWLLITTTRTSSDEEQDPTNQQWYQRTLKRLNTDSLNNIAIEEILRQNNLTQEDFNKIIAWEKNQEKEQKQEKKWWDKNNLSKIRSIGQEWHYAYTPHLDRYCTDLSKHDPTPLNKARLVGREKAVEMLLLTLAESQQNNALLIANPGTGRKTIIHHIARLIRTNQTEGTVFHNKRILFFETTSAIAQAQSTGTPIDYFLDRLFFEAAYAGNIILVMENIENYVDVNSATNITAILSQYLDLPTFRLVSITSPQAINRLETRSAIILKSSKKIIIDEPTNEEAELIILDHFKDIEKKHVLFTCTAIKSIVQYSSRYNSQIPLPERALDLANESLLYWKENGREGIITKEIIENYVTLKTGIPLGEIKEQEQEKLLNMESFLHERVIGQEHAINKIASAVRRIRTDITDKKKPVASFMFLGPTGVGKTETAKALAESYYGDENKMIRLDMSEYQTEAGFDRLLGAQERNEIGRLTTATRENPYALLLLDELDKAHPRILDIFLQILDEGYATDSFNQRINFTNMIIIATTNAGAVELREMLDNEVPKEDIKQKLIDVVVKKNSFRIEFLNRFSDIILFEPLKTEELLKVTNLLLEKLQKRLHEEKGIPLLWKNDVPETIIQKSYQPLFGARSIARYIQNNIENIVAEKIIRHSATKEDPIVIEAKDIP
ncbi:MAG: ATP-dependent Clp protease ATP-binding subunit [Candidatus Moranbacteria bacterium]|nr:ATP-dependent Clp protease ATP-binding subunit [Candidatus Moranbacteria bacterium]